MKPKTGNRSESVVREIKRKTHHLGKNGDVR